MDRIFIDVHVIQTVPPSCVNRDDTGSPKTCVYGGVRRARVSSQSWKHAIRQDFEEQFPEEKVGVRTLKLLDLLEERISQLSPETPEPRELAKKIVEAAGLKLKEEKTGALFFVSRAQIDNLAKLALENKIDKKAAKDVLKRDMSIDIALFGRMVADDPSLNSDATCQVAHAISTHKVSNEYDYFTAVDDMSPEDNQGAGMIGTVEFNSSTLYRYGTVAMHELFHALDDKKEEAVEAACAFVKAFILSMPGGKMNTFANRTVPNAVMICIRGDQPASLSGAFEKPIRSESEGYAASSVKAMLRYNDSICQDFLSPPAKEWLIGEIDEEVTVNLKEALEGLNEFLRGEFRCRHCFSDWRALSNPGEGMNQNSRAATPTKSLPRAQ